MFFYAFINEKHMVDTLLTDIHNDINNDSSLNEIQKNSYLAELQYILAYTGYNDFNKMREAFNVIPSLSKSPVNIVANGFPFNFECPSVMMLYHRQAGALDDEMNTLEQYAPDYYRITNGHGKGFEAVMKAEFYITGEIWTVLKYYARKLYIWPTAVTSMEYILQLIIF